VTPQQKDTLVAMAVALLLIQTTERVIKLCMTFVLQRSSPLTLEILERQEKEERRKTLGYFLGELRKRADLDPGFDALLEEFLEKRNILVHHFGAINEYSLNTEAGLAAGNAFVHRMIQVTESVLKVFIGLTQAWQEQVGMPAGITPDHPFFTEIEKAYKPLVNEMFLPK
jgi:hypothetical protein